MYTVEDKTVFYDGKEIHTSSSARAAKHLCKQLNSGAGFNLHVPEFFLTSYKKRKAA